MKRTVVVMSAALILAGAALASAQEAAAQPGQPTSEKAAKIQTVCPVMGEAIDRASSPYVDHDGKRIYVCCKMCLKKVQADPAKYIKQLEDQGIILDKAGTAETAPMPSVEHGCH